METASPKPSPTELPAARSDDASDEITEESMGAEADLAKKEKGQSTQPLISKAIHLSKPEPLIAVDKRGKDISIRIILSSQPFVSQAQTHTKINLARRRGRTDQSNGDSGMSPKSSEISSGNSSPALGQSAPFLGQDGNLFHCHVCHGFGDVVCCDGCPHVYHPECIPPGDPSRVSLENDDEPWFCPNCFEDKAISEASPISITPAGKRSSSQGERRAVKRRCCECHQSGGPNRLEPCEGCGAHLHFPSCRSSAGTASTTSAPVLCSTCRSEMAQRQEEDERKRTNRKRKKSKADQNEGNDSPDDDASSAGGVKEKTPRRRTRALSLDDDAGEETSPDDGIIYLRTIAPGGPKCVSQSLLVEATV